jgi:CspA family cold shock protein
MKTGKVKFFNAAKGFGFIKLDEDPSKEVFVHISGLEDKNDVLKENDEVSFDVGEGKKGPIATNVRKTVSV